MTGEEGESAEKGRNEGHGRHRNARTGKAPTSTGRLRCCRETFDESLQLGGVVGDRSSGEGITVETGCWWVVMRAVLSGFESRWNDRERSNQASARSKATKKVARTTEPPVSPPPSLQPNLLLTLLDRVASSSPPGGRETVRVVARVTVRESSHERRAFTRV